MKRAGPFLVAALLAAPAQPACADAGLTSYGVRLHAQVRSLYEIRHARVVQQKWDQSCGSAALSTLLTYYLDTPTDETSIIGDLIRHGDPLRVRQRGGFSLLDLKRFVQRHGYRSRGYGRLSLPELAAFKTAAIVPIKTHGYDHFVIFVSLIGDRVVLADPAYGNMSLTARQFGRIWQNGIAFMVFRGEVRPAEEAPAPDPQLPIPQLSSVERSLRGLGPVPPVRVGR
jgi:uncharacterized protein